MTHTKDLLAEALLSIGLMDMAANAASGFYHDFLSPLDTPTIQLVNDLAAVATPEAMALRKRIMNGDFDASPEESDEWAASPEGQAAFSKLIRKP